MVFINPEITWSSEEQNIYEEGCLSIPDYYEEVERPARVKFRYSDLDGKFEVEADGLLATCLQHEIDHLDGVLFIDHLSRLKRERVTKLRQGGKARAGRRRQLSRVPGPATRGGHDARRLHGHARFRRADPHRDRRPGPRGRGGLHPAPATAGRGMEVRPSPVQRTAEQFGLPVLTPTLRAEEAAELPRPRADVAVVVAYGMILPQAILDAPGLGCLNLHASLLPRWRGAAPIQRAIMAGDTETGVAVMRMEEGLDTGPVAMVERVRSAPMRRRANCTTAWRGSAPT